jgi:hypothetical protein
VPPRGENRGAHAGTDSHVAESLGPLRCAAQSRYLHTVYASNITTLVLGKVQWRYIGVRSVVASNFHNRDLEPVLQHTAVVTTQVPLLYVTPRLRAATRSATRYPGLVKLLQDLAIHPPYSSLAMHSTPRFPS